MPSDAQNQFLQALMGSMAQEKQRKQALVEKMIEVGALSPTGNRPNMVGDITSGMFGPSMPQAGKDMTYGGSSYGATPGSMVLGNPERMKQMQEVMTQAQSPKFQPAMAYTRQAISQGANPNKLIPQLSSRYNQPEQRKAIEDISKTAGLSRQRFEKSKMDTALRQNAKDISQGIMDGSLPPDLNQVASFKDRSAVAAELKRQGVNLTEKRLDWIAATKYAQTKEGPAQVRLRQAIDSVTSATDNLKKLNEQFTRTNYAPINKAQIVADANTGNSLAVKYLAQLTVIQDELGQVFMGGNSPTDRTIQMAQNLLKSNFSVKQLNSVIDTLKDNLTFRKNAIENVPMADIGGQANIYARGGNQGRTKSGLTYTIEQ